MNDIFLGRLQVRYFRTVRMSPPPEVQAPTDEALKLQAEEAAQREKDELKKKRRPTLLTGYGGAQGEAGQMVSLMGGNTKLGQ